MAHKLPPTAHNVKFISREVREGGEVTDGFLSPSPASRFARDILHRRFQLRRRRQNGRLSAGL
jgi:hypothetical protein